MNRIRTYTESSDIGRALSGKNFVLGVIGLVLMIFVASVENIINVLRSSTLLQNGYHGQLILNSLSSGWVTMALPVISAMPYTNSFIDDIKTGYVKLFIHRTYIQRYITAKLLACITSGGLVVFLGIIISYIISFLVFTPVEIASNEMQIAQPYFVQLLSISFMFFLSGAFWSLTGFMIAALTMNKYMAYASPFILYYVLIILNERYLKELYVLYPKEWLFPSDKWIIGSSGVFLILAELIVIFSLIFVISARRRINNA